jgi:hypothetical protein
MPRIPPNINIGQATIKSGQSTSLSWNAPGAIWVLITGVGSVSSSGTMQVSPDNTTTYILSATYIDGNVQSTSVTVTVERPPYLLWGLIALLAAAVVVIVILLVRRPAAARRAQAADTQGAYTPESKATLSTETLPATTPVEDVAAAKLTMPDGNEILLAGNARSFGRHDFEEFMLRDHALYISRQHINIWYQDGQYYIEDRSSTNGTRINGIDVKGTGRHALADGDAIELAGKLTIAFKKLNANKEE